MDIRKNGLLVAAALLLLVAGISSCRGISEEHNHEQKAGDISVMQAYELIKRNQDNSNFVILDIRTAAEYRAGHIENAVNIDFHGRDFREKLDGLDREKT